MTDGPAVRGENAEVRTWWRGTAGHGGLGMYVWMAKHRQQYVTCGHLHAKEVEAWGCLNLQDDPQDWKLLSTWLSSADMGGGGKRTK